jgi:hypothetical protein
MSFTQEQRIRGSKKAAEANRGKVHHVQYKFTAKEVRILIASTAYENAITAEELSVTAQMKVEEVRVVLSSLAQKDILRRIEDYDGETRYSYADNSAAQGIYSAVNIWKCFER